MGTLIWVSGPDAVDSGRGRRRGGNMAVTYWHGTCARYRFMVNSQGQGVTKPSVVWCVHRSISIILQSTTRTPRQVTQLCTQSHKMPPETIVYRPKILQCLRNHQCCIPVHEDRKSWQRVHLESPPEGTLFMTRTGSVLLGLEAIKGILRVTTTCQVSQRAKVSKVR